MSRKPLILIALVVVSGLALTGAALFILLGDDDAGAGGGASALELPAGSTPSALRLTIDETGLNALPAATLRRAGLLDGDLDAAAFRLSRDGSIVPTFVAPLEDGQGLFFYAEANDDPTAPPVVYWLTAEPGTPMAERDAAPSGDPVNRGEQRYRWANNEIFVALAQSSDPWFGARLFAPGSTSTWEMPLEGIEPAGEVFLSLRVWSNNETRSVDPDHHLEVSAGGETILDHTWDGLQLVTISGTIPAETIARAETVMLSLPNDTGAVGEDVYLDWLEIAYTGVLDLAGGDGLTFGTTSATVQVTGAGSNGVVLDITEPATPILLRGTDGDGTGALRFDSGGGTTFHAARLDGAKRPVVTAAPQWDSLRAADRGADYLVIHADDDGFADVLQPLLDRRADQGLAVTMVNVRQVFDEFGHGRQTPEAIRAFIAHAMASWQPAPRFVLLAGDASYDVNGFTDAPTPNLLPTRLIYTEYAGYVATDTWFVMPDAEEGTAEAPRAALGRLPAQSAADLEVMIGKIISYEDSADATWSRRALLVADDEAQFDEVSNALAFELDGAGYATQQLNMTEREDIDEDILNAFNGGVGLVNYVGHGSVSVWGDERVLETADVENLSNSEQYPIFVTFTCLNGYFNHPSVDALAEALMRAENGGIVAAVAPSGRSLTIQQRPIADTFYELLLSGDAATLGEALTEAKAAGADDPFLSDVIHTFNLLGDPALRFRRPPP